MMSIRPAPSIAVLVILLLAMLPQTLFAQHRVSYTKAVPSTQEIKTAQLSDFNNLEGIDDLLEDYEWSQAQNQESASESEDTSPGSSESDIKVDVDVEGWPPAESDIGETTNINENNTPDSFEDELPTPVSVSTDDDSEMSIISMDNPALSPPQPDDSALLRDIIEKLVDNPQLFSDAISDPAELQKIDLDAEILTQIGLPPEMWEKTVGDIFYSQGVGVSDEDIVQGLILDINASKKNSEEEAPEAVEEVEIIDEGVKLPELRPNDPFTMRHRHPNLHKKYYKSDNRHIPPAYYEHEYVRLLYDAIGKNDLNTVRAILKYFRDYDVVNEKGDTPLIFATMVDNMFAVRSLLFRGATVDYQNRDGNTALHVAIFKLNQANVETLLQFNADVGAANASGITPLMLAAERDRSGVLLKKMLDNGGKESVNKLRNDNNSALHLAVQANNVKALQLLLQYGAHVDIKNSQGNTPLHIAAAKGYRQSALYLLQSGADSYAVNAKGNTPMDLARYYRHAALVRAIDAVRVRQKFSEANVFKRREQFIPQERYVDSQQREDIAIINDEVSGSISDGVVPAYPQMPASPAKEKRTVSPVLKDKTMAVEDKSPERSVYRPEWDNYKEDISPSEPTRMEKEPVVEENTQPAVIPEMVAPIPVKKPDNMPVRANGIPPAFDDIEEDVPETQSLNAKSDSEASSQEETDSSGDKTNDFPDLPVDDSGFDNDFKNFDIDDDPFADDIPSFNDDDIPPSGGIDLPDMDREAQEMFDNLPQPQESAEDTSSDNKAKENTPAKETLPELSLEQLVGE